MAITSFPPTQTYPRFRSLTFPEISPVSITQATAVTLTAAQVLGGLILLDPDGGTTATMPTFTLLAAAIQGVAVGCSFEFTIRNTAGGAETITVAAGTGGTTSGTMTIAQSNSKRFLVVFTSSTGVLNGGTPDGYTIYSLGTVTT